MKIHRATPRQLANEVGMATMEAVLIMIVAVSLATAFTRYATNQGFLINIVEGPWSPIRGMIEDGVWMKHTVSKAYNPNHFNRRQSRRGDGT